MQQNEKEGTTIKKFTSVLLVLAMMVSLAACGGGSSTQTLAPSESSEQSQQPMPAESAPHENDLPVESEQQSIEVDKNLFDVELTIPADFLGENVTQEELDAAISENNGIKSVVLNADGSATYTMTKAAHAEMLDGIKEQIDTSLDEMISGEDYTFTEIEHNEDYTKFTVKTEADGLSMADSFSVLAFYMYGGMYAAFAGNEITDIQVEFVNATTGEIIDTANSSEMGE